MTSDELLKRINDAETKLNLWKSVHSSPGYAHQVELLNKLKSDKQTQDVFCAFVGWDHAKLMEMLTALDNELLLGDQIAASADADIALLNKVKSHTAILWGIAALLG